MKRKQRDGKEKRKGRKRWKEGRSMKRKAMNAWERRQVKPRDGGERRAVSGGKRFKHGAKKVAVLKFTLFPMSLEIRRVMLRLLAIIRLLAKTLNGNTTHSERK